jgi:PTH2 family peptidyl-tRNA hydrolase
MKAVKQVIVVRKDLKMRRGKEITQGSHASGAFMEELYRFGKHDKETDLWLEQGKRKITMVVQSEEELLNIYNAAKKSGLKSHLIVDAGLTDAGSGKGNPTRTAVAIGPNYEKEIDKITGREGQFPGKLY